MKIMKLNVSFVGLCLAAATLFAGCSPALNWRSVQTPEAPALQALFPCKPKAEQRELVVPGASAQARAVHLLRCEAGGRTWALSFTTVDDAAQVSQVLAEMAAGLRSSLELASRGDESPNAAVQALDLGPADVPGATPQAAARAIDLAAAQGRKVRAWHFSHGLSVFQATVWQHGSSVSEQDADDASKTFLAGFNFQP